MSEPDYGMTVSLAQPFDAAVAAVTEALKGQGFGVLTTIDVQATLRDRLGVAMERYLILGACNPPLAHRALTAERSAGLLLPCNVIVYEVAGGSEASILDPIAMLGISDSPALAEVATEARAKLAAVAEQLRAGA